MARRFTPNPFNTDLFKAAGKRSPAIPTATAGVLPTNDHTHDHQAKPKTWLKIKHIALEPNQPLDQLDIYDDIYKSERIGLIACKRYDAKGQPKPYTEEEFKRVRYWDLNGEGAERDVRLSEANPADYQGRPHTIYSPTRTPYSDDNYHLRGKGSVDLEAS